jgi:RNA polymerase sigma-70 factor (ECF subfamily)
MQQVLDSLSPRKRMIVVLRHYQQMKIHEIAAVLGCSQGSVKKQLFVALSQLKNEMGPLAGG